MKKEEIKTRIKNLAYQIAHEKTEAYGTDYTQAVDEAIKEACARLGISEKEGTKLFI